ncbi:MAG: 7TM diverse intracellular signaling domain-containing protein [Bacteroidota bacterium]
MNVFKKIVYLILYIIPFQLSGQDIYYINDTQDQHIFVHEYIEYLEDPESNLTFEDILSEDFQDEFIVNHNFAPENYNLNSSYWFKVRIQHKSSSDKKWLLEFFDQTIDHIVAYIPKVEGNYSIVELGDENPFRQRRIKHKNFVIPIENDHDHALTYYFNIKASHPVNIILVIRSFDYFTYYSLNEYFLFGLFYGLIILIGLYNLLLYFAIRETPYLYFVGYAFSIVLFFSSLDGFAYQFVWPIVHGWNSLAYGVFMYLIVLFSCLFTRRFLHLENKASWADKVLIGLITLRSLYFIFCLFLAPTFFDYLFIDLVPLIILLSLSIYFFWKGYKPARLMMLAFLFLMVGAVIKLLLSTGISGISSDVALFFYSMNAGFLAHLVTLSLALGDKVRIIKQRKDRAMKRIVTQHEINSKLQNKVNKELEQKVKERTLEINAKKEEIERVNEKLAEQAEEINKINRILDKDNWNLKKETRFKMQKLLLSNSVSFYEFKKVFPNDLSCHKYLLDLKWRKGFTCKKCYYSGYSTDNSLARRCSSCGYIESVKSHTVFHNLRFPLLKAFYIAHIEISGSDMTLTELSDQLELRVATCSAFRNKIKKMKNLGLNEHDKLYAQFLLLN